MCFHHENSVGGEENRREDGKMCSRTALEGWKWFVYIFSCFMEFSETFHIGTKLKRESEEFFSYQAVEEKRSCDFFGFPARSGLLINASEFYVFTTTRDAFTIE